MSADSSPPSLALTLLRHAKSSWREPHATDHERSLNKRGRTDAPIMAERLRQRNLGITHVLCSDAQRTCETAEIVMPILGLDASQLILDSRIYEASVDDLLAVIKAQSGRSLLLIGHNPGLELLCQLLAPGQVPRMPTCAVASFSVAAEHWDQALTKVANHQSADLAFHDFPKNQP